MFLILVGTAAPAAAHAVLVASSPTDGARLEQQPASVTLTFDERVELVPDATKVIATEGTRADDGHPTLTNSSRTVVITLRQDLPAGSYAAMWRVISADSHLVTGSIRFGIRADPVAAPRPPPPPGSDTLGAVSQGLVYTGIILCLGLFTTTRLFSPRSLRIRMVRGIVGVGGMLLVAATIGQLAAAGLRAGDLNWAFLHHPGPTLAVRLVLLAGISSALLLRRDRSRDIAMGLLGCGVLVSVARTGHSGVGDHVWLATASAVLHLAAMACWLGGLVLWLLIRRDIDLPRWSRFAYGCVAVLILTGEYQGWRQVQPLESLWHTDYGVILLLKLALVTAMIIIAKCARPTDLRRRVALEATLAAAAVAVTALLVTTPPARNTFGPPTTLTAPLGADNAVITLDTTRHGRQRIDISVNHADTLTATLSAPDAGIAPLKVNLIRVNPTTWRSTDAVTPVPGQWMLTLTVPQGPTTLVTSAHFQTW